VRDATFYASGLLELHNLSGADRRASWRQSMAMLARVATEDGPGPLEGLHPNALVAGVRSALQAGLADDLDWLAPAAAGVALYELASALPVGAEQREVGRRALARLLAGDAATFVTMARRMALGGGRGLGSAGTRARIALVVELPIGLGIADGPLALALASRRNLAREWIGDPSTGSLPSRRLAARLIERAASEAARRAGQGDDHSLRVFKGDAIAPSWERLLADRESLVWRHLAVARGLLAPWVPALAKEMEDALAPTLSPTEWRRAAASIAAYVAVAPERGLELAQRAVAQGLLDRDPGAAAAFLWGLPRAADAEPEAAMELLDLVLAKANADLGEAAIDLRTELGESPAAEKASARALALLAARPKGSKDDGAEAIALEVSRDLEGAARDDEPVRAQIARALDAFASQGAREAYALARDVLSAARGSVDALDAVSPDEDGAEGRAGSIARRASLAVLRDLDVSLLENDVLAHLLTLGGGEAARGVDETLDGLRDRMAEWILAREGQPLEAPSGRVAALPAHPTLSMRRLRALLHLADGDVGDDESDPPRAARRRNRCLRIARVLLTRAERGPASPVRRTIVAALARSLDAVVRVGVCDVIDAFLLVARHVVDPGELLTLGEAAMNPELVHVLERYAVFSRAVSGEVDAALRAHDELARDLALEASSRSEALRSVLVRLGSAIGAMASAESLRALAPSGGSEPEVVSSLETALGSLAQLSLGARARLDPESAPAVPNTGLRPLTVAVSRVLSGADASLGAQVLAAALEEVLAGVPRAIGNLVTTVVWQLTDLPKESRDSSSAPSLRVVEALPTWLSPRRTIGGFYVVRALGAGAVGSVFVATRVEDKGEPGAERFALKVPEYSASVARSLSEVEFLTMFRDEASALIALPSHPNLARFVTFDAGSKPKPILVMELVEGTTLEHLLEARGVDTARVLGVLDDVLRGLEAMHSAGVGHLDLKPSNVVLRRDEQAVLVDFGLAGRHIRPGCATGAYGAPEVWGALEGRKDLTPMKADVYAFGCVAFEALTGKVLFQADTEMAQIAKHVGHDGSPPPLRELQKRAELRPLTELLVSTLRQDPSARPTASTLRKELARMAPALGQTSWPLGDS
jgi:eukaryotic-like serine/threonine-protein kinase